MESTLQTCFDVLQIVVKSAVIKFYKVSQLINNVGTLLPLGQNPENHILGILNLHFTGWNKDLII